MDKRTTVDMCDLRHAVQNMEGLTQEAFSEIAAIAGLALSTLETPGAYLCSEDIAYALTAIRNKAQCIGDLVNCEAKRVGCGYEDEAALRRFEARRTAAAMCHAPEVSE
ncbi:hypothetical protein [Ralstonia sp.]|uniref:hypothetical protein n=1 Tax=Ralstonia sp. TaxID=54061 RepID=UPI0031D649A4